MSIAVFIAGVVAVEKDKKESVRKNNFLPYTLECVV